MATPHAWLFTQRINGKVFSVCCCYTLQNFAPATCKQTTSSEYTTSCGGRRCAKFLFKDAVLYNAVRLSCDTTRYDRLIINIHPTTDGLPAYLPHGTITETRKPSFDVAVTALAQITRQTENTCRALLIYSFKVRSAFVSPAW